jgi:hypothetical protein
VKEKQRIEAAGGYVENGRVDGYLNLSRALGDHCFKRSKLIPSDQQKISNKADISIYATGVVDFPSYRRG